MAQTRPGGTSGTATRSTSTARPATSAFRPATTTRPATSASRPATTTRPATGTTTRPATTTRPGTSTTTRPSTSTSTLRPGSTGSTSRPGTGGSALRPGNTGTTVRPGTSAPSSRPGTSTVRPGGGTANRPVGPSQPAYRPGSSVAKPGGWTPVTPPHNNWASPSYRPPRPGGGYWNAPAPSRFRIGYWAPPVPPRYSYAVVGVPTLGTILGLTFGSFIDTGINSLYNAGYQVAGYADNVIYLTNVSQLGLLWPEVAMQYTDGLLTNSQFAYYSATPGMGRYNNVYSQLSMIYGAPVASTGSTATWWAGDNTGYITLHYAYMNSLQGVPGYYTTLTYSAYY